MIIDRSSKLIWGIVAFGIYFLLLGLVIYYFNTHHDEKTQVYVKKNEKRIQVTLAPPPITNVLKKVPKKLKVKVTPKIKKNIKMPKKVKPIVKKKIVKEKIVKKIAKKKDINITKNKNIKKVNIPKVKKTLDLFADVKTTEKKLDMSITKKPIKSTPTSKIIKIKDKPLSASERINSTLKRQKDSRSGEENAYFAKVQSMLEDWPAQIEFAGEKAKVVLYIKTSGEFEFKVQSASTIDAFNEGLIAFLEQLQSIGFGPHNGERTYEYEAEFIAKE